MANSTMPYELRFYTISRFLRGPRGALFLFTIVPLASLPRATGEPGLTVKCPTSGAS